MLTTAARSFASWPSLVSGCASYRVVVTTSPSTESPRNSSRSLCGSPPASYAYERWVRARPSTAASTGPPVTSWRWSSSSLTGRSGVSAPDEADPLPMRAGSALVLGALGRAVVAALVGATRRTRHVRLGERLALGAGRRGDGRRLPVGAARAGVGARHLPLRNGHVRSSSLSAWAAARPWPRGPPIGGRSHRAGAPGPPRAASRTRSTARGSRAGTPAGTAVQAPPCPGAPVRGR